MATAFPHRFGTWCFERFRASGVTDTLTERADRVTVTLRSHSLLFAPQPKGFFMASASSAVDQAATLLKERINELESELAKLQRALANLTDGRQGRRGPGRPRGSRAGTTTRRRRRRRGGTRADQAVKLIQQNPGITAAEIARRMSIQPNYMYRVLGDLQKEGKVKKSGRSYTAA
jgi:hypothetical protein